LFLFVVPLIALYFFRIRRKKVRVSSVIGWRALVQEEGRSPRWRTWSRHVLLLLQIGLLLLLAIALARPTMRSGASTGQAVVMIVDTSASMGATDIHPTRLDAAVGAALNLVAELDPTDEVMLIAAGPSTDVLVPFTHDHGLLQRALHALAPTEAEGELRESVQLGASLARARPGIEIVVFSDGGGESLAELDAGGVALRMERIGVSADNCGIVSLDLRRSPVSDLERQLFVTITNFGSRPSQASVEVYLEDRLVGMRSLSLEPEVALPLVFELSGSATGEVRVQIRADGDRLSADDVAVALLRPKADRRVLLVEADALTASVLAADNRLEVRAAKADALTPADVAWADAVVISGTVPGVLAGLPMMVMGPFEGGAVRYGPAAQATLRSWERGHATQRFVQWDGVHIARARSVRDDGGLVPVVHGLGGPLLLAGEVRGARVVQLSFDPLESDLPLRVAWPVLLMNTVGWLTESPGGEAAVVPTGQPWVSLTGGSGDPVAWGPEGSAPTARLDGGRLSVEGLDRVGIYGIALDGEVQRVAANLLSSRESRIEPRDPIRDREAVVLEAGWAPGQRALWRLFLSLFLALLAVEWTWFHRRTIP